LETNENKRERDINAKYLSITLNKMARNDISFLTDSPFGNKGSRKYKVTSGTTASIKAGEPVMSSGVGGYLAAAMYSTTGANKPVCGADYLLGIAASDSTETATAVGYVEVIPVDADDVMLVGPKVAATFDTQAEYDLLVGDRVLMDFVTAGNYTLLAADGATSGFVIEPLDVTLHPGKVAFRAKAPLSILYPAS
jgi:hypothetical protein